MNIRSALRSMIMRLPLRWSRSVLLVQEYKRIPNMKYPKTFNEKVSYRILHDRRHILAIASSKVDSKNYVESLATGVKIPRTIWHGTNLGEVNGLNLDTDWVLKASHRSGRMISGGPGILDVTKLNINESEWLLDQEYIDNKLWGYFESNKEFILEERIGAKDDFPEDLKFFVFDGKVAMIQHDHGRHSEHFRNLYDENWSPLPWTYSHPRGRESDPPKNFSTMIEIASAIGADLDFVRVDLYNVDGEIYFGEMTMYPAAGLSAWPRELDLLIGSKWSLPSNDAMRDSEIEP